jgi:hypothetical protein
MHPTLIDLLSGRFEPVREQLMASIDGPKTVFMLASTCRAIRSSIYAHEWDINTKLKRFVDDPVAFRNQLGDKGLISGSFALQFFERVTWKESDLDIFMNIGGGHTDMWKYLVTAEGYQAELSVLNDSYRCIASGENDSPATFQVIKVMPDHISFTNTL